jgi:HK97 family phage prohead protease
MNLGHQQRVVEQVAPSFFNKSKGDGWPGVTARFEHDPRYILASTRAHTLELRTDRHGLYYSAELPESRRDIYESVDRGDVAGSSFSFAAFDDEWDWVDGETRRTLLSGKLIDVGPTSQPAYEDASVAVLRSLAAHVGAEYEEVRSLATAGDLRKLFVRADLAPGVPTPLEVAQRSYVEPQGTSDEVTLRRQVLDLRAKLYGYDTRPESDPAKLLLNLYRRKLAWNRPDEVRSVATTLEQQRTPAGHLIDIEVGAEWKMNYAGHW